MIFLCEYHTKTPYPTHIISIAQRLPSQVLILNYSFELHFIIENSWVMLQTGLNVPKKLECKLSTIHSDFNTVFQL